MDRYNSSTSSVSSSPRSPITRLWQKLSPKRALDKPSSSSSSFHSELAPAAAVATNDSSNQHSNNSAMVLERVFEHFDEDGDGRISAAELQSCLRTVGIDLTTEEAETAVLSSDSDGDGILGFEDFKRMVEGGGDEEKAEELREAFGMYAVEGSTIITPKSLKRMLSRLGESSSIDSCKAMIRRFDLNSDGVLNFDEFTIMMR